MPPCDPNLSQPTGNHRSVRLTRSVRRRAASFKSTSGKLQVGEIAVTGRFEFQGLTSMGGKAQRRMQLLRKHLITKPENRLRQVFPFSLTANVCSKSGSLLLAQS